MLNKEGIASFKGFNAKILVVHLSNKNIFLFNIPLYIEKKEHNKGIFVLILGQLMYLFDIVSLLFALLSSNHLDTK